MRRGGPRPGEVAFPILSRARAVLGGSSFRRGHAGRRPRLRYRLVLATVALVTVVILGAGACSGSPTSTTAPSSPAPPGAAALTESPPQRVHIPAISVDSAVMGLGLRADRRMEVPPGAFPAGWYSRGPTPGEVGPAVLAGHVDWAGHPGVFARLHDLEPQDEVEVTREDRTVAVFRVTRVDQVPKDAFPTQRVYGNLDRPGLRLITCGGELDRQARSYEDNIVVFADFVGTRHT